MIKEKNWRKGVCMMEGFSYNDIFATKGIEYLLVLAFLVGFILLLKYLGMPLRRLATARVGGEICH